jgi:hypothetical protein
MSATILLPFQPQWTGQVTGELVLQQQHQWKWVWSGSCDKYMGGTIAAGLFASFIGCKVKTWNVA